MKRLTIALGVPALLISPIIFLPVITGASLSDWPDLLVGRRRILAEKKLSDGNLYKIIQYWNVGDSYNTELVRVSPKGSVKNYILDADDIWRETSRLDIQIDKAAQNITVTIDGGKTAKIPLQVEAK